MLLNLSRRLTNKPETRLLAINGLQIKKHIIDKHLHDESNITEAYRILDEWFKNQPNSRKAYNRLCKALGECNMSGYIKCIQMGTLNNSESSDCEE